MDDNLFNLNFDTLLKYPDRDHFEIKNRYEDNNPIPCSGFCTCCENELGLKAATPPLMSHGCSIDEIRTVLGVNGDFAGGNDQRIMLLLENPGGDYENGKPIGDTIIKCPPVYHFYFSPSVKGKWPTTIEEIAKNPYGNYFAYLIYRYALNNVYITNCIKCKYTDEYEETKKLCVKQYLKKEIDYFKPEIVIFFGHRAEHIFNDSKDLFPDFHGKTCYLWHPATRRSRKNIIKHNNDLLDSFFIKDLMDRWYQYCHDKCSDDFFVDDGPFPYYERQKVKILFIGRELPGPINDVGDSRRISYIENRLDMDKLGVFQSRLLYLAYGIHKRECDFSDWLKMDEAKELNKIFASDGSFSCDQFSYAFMNASKLVNTQSKYVGDLFKKFIGDEVNREFFIREIELLNPDIIVSGNLADEGFFTRFEGIIKEDRDSIPWNDNCSVWQLKTDRMEKAIPWLDGHHFSARKETFKKFYEPICQAAKGVLDKKDVSIS